MAISDFTMNISAWYCFGAVAFLGAFTAYQLIKSRVVQAIGLFLLSMVGGFAALSLIGAAINWMIN